VSLQAYKRSANTVLIMDTPVGEPLGLQAQRKEVATKSKS
jgi:hypothetical protein